ncbi:MAG TPA: hypothetical protein VNT22_08665 [Baekduia sp.]|nr:hypothetical protein [Baekduia sp.]
MTTELVGEVHELCVLGHGPKDKPLERIAFDDEVAVYDALLEAGRPLGLRQLGSRVYITSHHTENGFPNTYVHCPPAFAEDEAMAQHMRAIGVLTDDERPWPALRAAWARTSPTASSRRST